MLILSNFGQNSRTVGRTPWGMASSTVLCIHRNPSQLSLLAENGFKLVTATNGHDGLRIFSSQAVDAIVLEYHLGFLDGAVVASAIKQVRPKVPIVMLVDSLELPDGALKSVDAVVAKSDGPHFLWAAVDFVVNVKPSQSLDQARSIPAGRGHPPISPHLNKNSEEPASEVERSSRRRRRKAS